MLEAFINSFYGYGNYQAPYWFIGMEEAGGVTEQQIARQLEIWNTWGRGELLDVVEYARAMGITNWYGDKPALQRTWRNLIRVFLTAKGQIADNEVMRQYQKTVWGTKNGETCLLELLPLPSPSIGHWIYGQISTLPYLATREDYRQYVADSRVSHLQDRVVRYQPKAVVFYGVGYCSYWKKIAKVEPWAYSSKGVYYAASNPTLFIITEHPTRSTNEHFNNIGKFIAEFKN
jgi:hypothetical protein